MTDLRELLGARYDRTMGDAYVAFRARLIFNTAPNAIVADAIERALAAVLPDLLADARREGQADAWDEGHWQGKSDAAMNAVRVHAAFIETPNPYRAAHAAAHSAPEASSAHGEGSESARPADGIVSVAQYGNEGGER